MHGIELSSAGCVVLAGERPDIKVLLIWTMRHPDPNLPKGKVEQGETPMECAVREVREETGYEVKISHPRAIRVETYLNRFPPPVHKTIEFYLGEVVAGDPEQRKEKRLVTRVDWWPAREALMAMRKVEEKEALRRCLDLDRYLREGAKRRPSVN